MKTRIDVWPAVLVAIAAMNVTPAVARDGQAVEARPRETIAPVEAEHDDRHGHGHDHTQVEHGEAPPRPQADPHDGHDDQGHNGHGHTGVGHAHEDAVKLTADAIRRQNITIATAAKRVLAPTFVVPGRVAFNGEAMAHVGAVVRGRVGELKVRTGDAVEKGAALLVVESPELGQAQSEYLQRRTAASVAEAAIVPARQAYERARALFDRNEGIALAEVQRREAEVKAAEGALATAKAAVLAAENTLRLLGMKAEEIKALADTGEIQSQYVIRAPIAGRVVEREVTLGELVSPEKEALLVIADLSNVWLLADVPEAQLADVAVGSRARVRTATERDAIEGEVSYIAFSVDPTTRTGRVRIVLPNAAGTLRPGMFARVELAAGGAVGEAVVAVPEQAVQTVEGQTVVFVPVEGEDNTFAARRVKVATTVGGFAAVADGLTDGDRFVATGSFILKAELGKSGAAHGH